MTFEWTRVLFQRPRRNSLCSDLVKLHELSDVIFCQCHFHLDLVQITPIHRVPARIADGLGTVYSSHKATFTHKMQAFCEYLQHAITIYKVEVNTNKMIFVVE